MTITMKTMTTLLPALIQEDVAAFVWGAPGIGKTEAVEQVARSMGIGFLDCRLNIREPVDLAGLPVADMAAGVTRWMQPDLLPQLERDGPRGIFFLDELNTVGPSMMPVAFQLIQERRAGTHKILDGWVPIAAGNRAKDKAAAQRMPTPLRSRLAHLTVEPHLESWVEWAIGAGIDPRLVAFLRFRPELLHIMPGQIASGKTVPTFPEDANSFPTPRGWAKVAKFIKHPRDIRLPLVAALVGDGPAAELEGFLRVCDSITPISEIIANPTGAPMSKDPATLFATSMGLARAATRANLDAVITYANRMPSREFGLITVVDAVKRDKTLCDTAAFGTWTVANQDVAL
jgi:hypothetical protein